MKKLLFLVIFILLNTILFSSTAAAADTSGGTAKTLYYRIGYSRSGNMEATIYLNGVPFGGSYGSHTSTYMTVNEWIVSGENILKIKIIPPKKSETASLHVELVAYEEGLNSRDEEQKLITYDWKKGDKSLQIFKMDVENPPVSDFWKTAKPITLSKKNKTAALAEFRNLEKAFEQRDSEKIEKLFRYRRDEINKFMDYDEPITSVSSYFFPDGDNDRYVDVVKSAADKELKFQLIANKRILWIYRSVATENGDKRALQIENAKGTRGMSLDIYMAPINGKWTFVR